MALGYRGRVELSESNGPEWRRRRPEARVLLKAVTGDRSSTRVVRCRSCPRTPGHRICGRRYQARPRRAGRPGVMFFAESEAKDETAY